MLIDNNNIQQQLMGKYVYLAQNDNPWYKTLNDDNIDNNNTDKETPDKLILTKEYYENESNSYNIKLIKIIILILMAIMIIFVIYKNRIILLD